MPRVNGFTFVELLITLTIITILSSLAAPSFSALLADSKIAAHHNELVAAISLARSEAIKRRQRVTLCQSADLNNCTKNSRKWHHGWLIYVDSDEDNKVDSGEPILRVQQALNDLTLSYGGRTRIAFHASGFAVGGSNGTFVFCDHRGEAYKKGLILSNTGRVRIAREKDLRSKTCS